MAKEPNEGPLISFIIVTGLTILLYGKKKQGNNIV